MTEQPEPIPNDSRPVWELVVDDMYERDAIGRRKYGVPLQASNGRDALVDAYAEALDMAVYLKTAIIERDTLKRIDERMCLSQMKLTEENAALRVMLNRVMYGCTETVRREARALLGETK